jgi:DNA-cytosine methyltransferase
MAISKLRYEADLLLVPPCPIWLLEDDGDTSRRQQRPRGTNGSPITVRLHAVQGTTAALLETWRYRPGSLKTYGRNDIAVELLARARAKRGIVVAGQHFATRDLAVSLASEHLDLFLEISSSLAALVVGGSPAGDLGSANWRSFQVGSLIDGERRGRLAIARVGIVQIWDRRLTLFALAPGGLTTSSLVRYAVSSRTRMSLEHAAGLLSWLRHIRRLDRRTPNARDGRQESAKLTDHSIGQPFRPNIHLSAAQDIKLLGSISQVPMPSREASPATRRTRASCKKVVELFAGAGLLGLGFLQSERGSYKLEFSGEVDPVYVTTLGTNHKYLAKHVSGYRTAVPKDVRPVDLRKRSALQPLLSLGRVDVVIGGPPCQGFSSANRNSWDPANPNNRLVDTFLRYVRALAPSAVVLENVQGILWTPKAGVQARTSTAHHIMRSLRRAGYDVSARLLDAAWYGVPQRRTRFFLVALNRRLGITPGDLGEWGPFPRPTHGPGLLPYVTVRQAIGDLPSIGNGHLEATLSYREPHYSELQRSPYLQAMRSHAACGVVTDHITSKQAEYVVDRYERIPPGGNWENIADLLTNYSDVRRTHSNIYRRLSWDEPAITIGHYRKAMIVHPEQDRGLSLREASRLQSIPDWFRFSGSPVGRVGGLMHKQQQLANAVSPLVAKAIAERLAELI